MRTSQTLQLEMSEKRSEQAAITEKLNAAVAAGTEPAAEDVGRVDTLTREYRVLEVRYRASVIAEDEEDKAAEVRGDSTLDAEAVELQKLETRAKVGSYLVAANSQRGVDGAEKELNAAIGIGERQVPMSLFAPSEEEARRLEHRTETDTNIALRPRRWLDRLFAGTAADYLGITMESVEPGQASYPLTATGGNTGPARPG